MWGHVAADGQSREADFVLRLYKAMTEPPQGDFEARLANVLKDFDGRQGVAEYQVATQLRGLLSKARDGTQEPPEALFSEAWVFGLVANYHGEVGNWGGYFGPGMAFEGEDGHVHCAPDLQEFTPATIAHWASRAHEARHPVLRARYADAAWDLSPSVQDGRRDPDLARIAVDGYLEAVEDRRYHHPVNGITMMRRSLSLAVSINDQERLERAIDTVITFEDREGKDDDSLGLWGNAFDLLVNAEKIALTVEQEDAIITGLEQRLSRASLGESPNPDAAERAAERLAPYYRRRGDREAVQRVLTTYGRARVALADQADGLVASHWMQQVRQLYSDYGLADEASALDHLIREAGEKAVQEMQPVTAKFEIPSEKLEEFLKALTDGVHTDVLRRIASHFLPQRDQVVTQVTELAKSAPFQAMISRTLVDPMGRPIAVVGSVEHDLDGQVILQTAQNMQINAPFLQAVFDRLRSDARLSEEMLVDHLYRSPVFEDGKRPLYERGLRAFREKDFITAVHVLIPQVEAAVRQIVTLSNGAIYRPRRGGGLQLRQLDDLLRDDLVRSVLGENACFYLRVLLTDQRGWNVRNLVAHGQLDSALIGPVMADRIIHSLLVLAEVVENQSA